MRVAHLTSVGDMAERLINGIHTLRREEVLACAPAAVAPRPLTDAELSHRGFASATSMLTLCLMELDGSVIERGIAQDIARRVIRAYLDQVERIGGRR